MRDTSKPPENQTLAVIESPDLAALFGEVGWTAALAIAEAADTAIIVGEVGWVPDPAALHEQAEIDAMVDRWEASDRARKPDRDDPLDRLRALFAPPQVAEARDKPARVVRPVFQPTEAFLQGRSWLSPSRNS